ncbi:DUF2535 family protein [Cytobacillus purgationiresistens]|uniref:DUF2535 family protein n=1 Tax=Cytobacillus purgationiresistens TaxID=863449 RepID=UPI0027D79DC0|nr:DUF2535 family protein [Cytobacillus purgationiresistens]
MLFKSLEFKNAVGQKVKIIDIPVLEKDSPYFFLVQVRLQAYMTFVFHTCDKIHTYSFKEYLKRVMRWPDYDRIFQTPKLKSNA